MSNDSRKMAVLTALKKLKNDRDSISLPELLEKLGSHFAERSVRRWLQELMAAGLVGKSGQKRSTRYFVVTASVDALPEKKFVFSTAAQKVLRAIAKPLFQRMPKSYAVEWVRYYKPNHMFYLSAKNRGILQSVGKPKSHDTSINTYTRQLYHRLLLDLSYNSSRLEGNTYSLGETEKLLTEGVDAAGKLEAETVMILNHKEAIRYLVDNAHRVEINPNTICTVHYLLSDGLVLAKDAGKIRDHSVRIGQSVYIPLDDQMRLTKQLAYICEVAQKIRDPHEQSFFLLVHLAYLQAFTDVNKRTARISANIPFIKNNFYPIAFKQIDKDDYISAMLAVYESRDVRALAELYVFSYVYTAHEYDALLDSMDINEIHVRFRREIRNIIRDIILKKLTGDALKKYIKQSVHDIIPSVFQSECVVVIQEELMHMGPERIHGLGITQTELTAWLKGKK